MNTYKKEKIELIKRNNLFLQMEGCKSVENNFKNINLSIIIMLIKIQKHIVIII